MELVDAQSSGYLRHLFLRIWGAVRCESANRGEEWSRKLLPVHVECPYPLELFRARLEYRDVLLNNEFKSGSASGISKGDARLLEYPPRARPILYRTVVAFLCFPYSWKPRSADDSASVVECAATSGIRLRFCSSAKCSLRVLQRRHVSLGNLHAGVVLHHANCLRT